MFPPEASWVTDMRDHFNRHGFYRREDLERLLGKPGDSVQVTVSGAVVYRAASAIEARQRTDPEEGLDPKGESAVPNGETPNLGSTPETGLVEALEQLRLAF
jgi:hypothetical protein